MKRRELITLIGGAAATWPMVSRAQQPAIRQIAYMTPGAADEAETKARYRAFCDGLERAGWSEGKNIRIERRWDVLTAGRVVTAVEEIVRLRPQVIVAQGTPISAALRAQTSSIPIVFVGATDPLGSGLVNSLAHPDGNATGFVNFEFSIGAKWVQTLKELAPTIKRVLVFAARENAGNQGLYKSAEDAAPALGVEVTAAFVANAADVQDVMNALSQQHDVGLAVLPTNFAINNRPLILNLTAQHRVPAIYPVRIFTAEGGLVSLDTDASDYYRRAGSYVDRILRGEAPGDLPVQVPTKYQLAINLKTAKALGLTVPLALLGRADEVIE